LIGVQIFWVQTILLHGTEVVSGKINTWGGKKVIFYCHQDISWILIMQKCVAEPF
jgi:hypothetical protein